MKHRVKSNKLGTSGSYTKSVLSNMAYSLFEYETIKTTATKAKLLKRYAEKLITIARKNNISSRKRLLSKVKNTKIYNKIIDDISKRKEDRNGGNVRVIRCGYRKGDLAPIAIVQLVDRLL